MRLGCWCSMIFFILFLFPSVVLESRLVLHLSTTRQTEKPWLTLLTQFEARMFTLSRLELSKESAVLWCSFLSSKFCYALTFPRIHLLHQLYYRDVNNNIMELLIMAYACKTSSARSIVGVIPYLPYSKQCKPFPNPFLVVLLMGKCSPCLNRVCNSHFPPNPTSPIPTSFLVQFTHSASPSSSLL